MKKGLSKEEKDELVENLKVYREKISLKPKEKVDSRLRLLYEFRSNFVHRLHLPPIKKPGTLFFGLFHETLKFSHISEVNNNNGLGLTVRLSLADLTSIVEKVILRNLNLIAK